jgi:hypothetical protein
MYRRPARVSGPIDPRRDFEMGVDAPKSRAASAHSSTGNAEPERGMLFTGRSKHAGEALVHDHETIQKRGCERGNIGTRNDARGVTRQSRGYGGNSIPGASTMKARLDAIVARAFILSGPSLMTSPAP